MANQKEVFLDTEGDQWFERNKDHHTSHDLSNICLLLKSIHYQPQTVLEIGCADGKNLNDIQQQFEADCFGIEPSMEAINQGKKIFPQITFQQGTADSLPFENAMFDTIIFGFCLYLCDREDLFAIAHQADRCLQDKGIIIIKDFCPPIAYRNKYSHKEGLYSYKMDYSQLFTWHPAYQLINKVVYTHNGFRGTEQHDEKVATLIMQKNLTSAFPDNPYANKS
jgi:ubiquinone/menaquinone biosynthesis C-methylase UbiE